MNYQSISENENNKFYTKDEYIAEIEKLAQKLDKTIKNDDDEIKRAKVLSTPMFAEYRKIHGYSETAFITNQKVYSYFVTKSVELLKSLNEYAEYLKSNPHTAEEIAAKIKKPIK